MWVDQRPKLSPTELRPASTRIVIPAQDLAVRDGLQTLFARGPLNALSKSDRGTVEIILAEVLNNIVEHAYARYPGEIEVVIAMIGAELHCCISDCGLPMPDGQLPAGVLAPLTDLCETPEGGFGWHMIRTLAKDLSYERDGGRNLLRFRLDTEQSAH